jgi:hypothetical protein
MISPVRKEICYFEINLGEKESLAQGISANGKPYGVLTSPSSQADGEVADLDS